MNIVIRLFFTFCSIISCSDAKNICADYILDIPKAPAIEASSALKNRDFRLISIGSFTNVVPGVNDNKLIEQMGTRLMQHTSDSWPDESCKNYGAYIPA